MSDDGANPASDNSAAAKLLSCLGNLEIFLRVQTPPCCRATDRVTRTCQQQWTGSGCSWGGSFEKTNVVGSRDTVQCMMWELGCNRAPGLCGEMTGYKTMLTEQRRAYECTLCFYSDIG